jgi:hypothetical protein
MSIDAFSFHDSNILEVKETAEQTIDFSLNFPIDWQNNVFEKRILRFKGVIYYHIDEIPFGGQPTILQIINIGRITKFFGSDKDKFETVRNKIEIQTNAGKRIIEYSDCDLIPPK